MLSFFKKTETLDEKYLKALDQADGQWEIADGWMGTTIVLHIQDREFRFVRETFGKCYESIDGQKRIIPKKIFEGVHRIAQEYLSRTQIERLGGYILDDDLRQAIADTKKVMNASDQIQMLTSLVEDIHKKHTKS